MTNPSFTLFLARAAAEEIPNPKIVLIDVTCGTLTDYISHAFEIQFIYVIILRDKFQIALFDRVD